MMLLLIYKFLRRQPLAHHTDQLVVWINKEKTGKLVDALKKQHLAGLTATGSGPNEKAALAVVPTLLNLASALVPS